jgi:hypothetical protein
MATQRVVERVPEPALVCRKCAHVLVGGTEPARLTLCGGCALNDARPRKHRAMRRTQWQRRRDAFLDRWLPLLLEVVGLTGIAVCLGYAFAQAMGWVR